MPKEKAKNSKSSKTARVLSLLTTPEELEEEGSVESPLMPENKQRAKDEAAQAEIRSALESELGDLLPPQDSYPPQGAPAVQRSAPASVVPAQEAQEETAYRPVVQTYVPETISTAAAPGADDYRDYCVVNITQSLVEAKTDKYMKLFGMCTCPHCHMDVVALALSNLPAKYVVANNKDVVPLLSMYESKYSAAIITQVMGACKKVLQRPHHKR